MTKHKILDPRQVRHFAVGDVAGYIVLTETHGEWKDDWDGEVHTELSHALDALEAARQAGYVAILVQCVRWLERRLGESD